MMAWWHNLHLLRPHMLWLLLALPVLWLLWRARQRRTNVWRDAVDPHLLPHLVVAGGARSRFAFAGIASAYALAVLALAGPSWRQGEQPLWQSRAPLVIALDLSSRTAASDLPPSRLLQARSKIAALLHGRSGGQIALVAYADDAFTVVPLTEDADNIALFLDDLSPEIMPADGQQSARAIAWSAKLLKQAGFEKGDIVLMTDQADNAARLAAATAVGQGYRVSVLGLGSAAGAAYRTPAGAIARARLDAVSLRSLAASGGGRYATLTRDDADLDALELLQPEVSAGSSQRDGEGRAWRDEGYWLLLPLLAMALLAFRRGAVIVLIVGLSLPWAMPAQAAERDWWRRADQREHAEVERGVQAYRKGDYAVAGQAFAGKNSADALYNLGNALARQGRYDEAVAAYDAALERQPGMADAIANRAAVQRMRQSPRNQGDGQGQPSNPNAGSNQTPPAADRQPSQSPKDSSAQPSPQQPAPSPDKSREETRPPTPSRAQTQSPESPADAKAQAQAQAQADAAQRERMRQAMRKQAGKPPVAEPDSGQAGPRDESPEQRERRQALEAWLRRVPDEPGGLLKTKFRLEYERRMREGQ